jgi:hypothetical protein
VTPKGYGVAAMEAIAGPFTVTASLLALGGVSKLVKPLPTAGAVLAVGLPGTALLRRPANVRLFGAAEAVLGLAAVATGHRALAALVAATYLGFAAFVVAALLSGNHVQTCGCLGETDVPPHWGHLVLNVAAAAVSLLAAATGGVGGLASTVADQPLAGVPFLGLCALSLWFCIVLLTVVPLATLPRERTA